MSNGGDNELDFGFAADFEPALILGPIENARKVLDDVQGTLIDCASRCCQNASGEFILAEDCVKRCISDAFQRCQVLCNQNEQCIGECVQALQFTVSELVSACENDPEIARSGIPEGRAPLQRAPGVPLCFNDEPFSFQDLPPVPQGCDSLTNPTDWPTQCPAQWASPWDWACFNPAWATDPASLPNIVFPPNSIGFFPPSSPVPWVLATQSAPSPPPPPLPPELCGTPEAVDPTCFQPVTPPPPIPPETIEPSGCIPIDQSADPCSQVAAIDGMLQVFCSNYSSRKLQLSAELATNPRLCQEWNGYGDLYAMQTLWEQCMATPSVLSLSSASTADLSQCMLQTTCPTVESPADCPPCPPMSGNGNGSSGPIRCEIVLPGSNGSDEPPEQSFEDEPGETSGQIAKGSCDVDAYADLFQLLPLIQSTVDKLGSTVDVSSTPGGEMITLRDLLGGTSLQSGAWTIANSALSTLMGFSERIIRTLGPGFPCQEPVYVAAMIARLLGGVIKQWISGEADDLIVPMRYITRRLCPVEFPDANSATQAWLAGEISDETFEVWATQNNKCWKPWRVLAQAVRSKLDAPALALLRTREQISESEYSDLMRRAGWIEGSEREAFFLATQGLVNIGTAADLLHKGKIENSDFERFVSLNGFKADADAGLWLAASESLVPLSVILDLRRRGEYNDQGFDSALRALGYEDQVTRDKLKALKDEIPPISELIRYMVRDVEDDAIVNRFGMDDQFEDKYKSKVKEWTEAIGFNDDIMKRSWRAHWIIPSPGQLFEMLHRLARLPDDDPSKVSLDDVRTALNQQDILPFWVDKLIAISKRPLTRVDIRRAFNIGELTEAEVKEAYLVLGYDEENANKLVGFAKRLRRNSLMASTPVKAYRAGMISDAAARRRLEGFGVPADEINVLIGFADEEISFKLQSRCVTGIRQRYMIGELTDPQTVAELGRLFPEPKVVQNYLAQFQCLKRHRSRTLSVGQLCELRARGALETEQFVRQLLNLGYSSDEAFSLIGNCDQRIDIREAKEQLAARRRKEADARREAAEQRRKDRELRSAADKQAKRLENLRKRQQRRDAMLVKAAERLARDNQVGIEIAAAEIRRVYALIQEDYALSADEVAKLIVLAVEKRPKPPIEEFEARVRKLAEASDAFAPLTAGDD